MGLALAPAAAQAAPSFTVAPSFPSSVTVGQTGLAASVTLTATGTAGIYPVDSGGRFIGFCSPLAPAYSQCSAIGAPWNSGITLTPSCGQTGAPAVTVPICQVPDLNVFRLSTTGTGAAGTTCASVVFDIATLDATRGIVRFTPRPSPDFASLAGPGSTCRIGFTFDVLKRPATDADASLAGTQTRALTTGGGWYTAEEDADGKKKVEPLRAVGQSLITFTDTPPPCTPQPGQDANCQPCPPGTTGTPPNCPPNNPPCVPQPGQDANCQPCPPGTTGTPPNCPPVEPPCVPEEGEDENCDPIVVPRSLLSARVAGPPTCEDGQFRVTTTITPVENVTNPASKVASVTIKRGTRTLGRFTRPTSQELGLRYVLVGNAKKLPAGRSTVRAIIRLKGDGTFVRGQLVQRQVQRDSFELAKDCKPSRARISSQCTGEFTSALYYVRVTGIRDARKIASVVFRRGGRTVKTLTRATNGNVWVLNGRAVSLRPAKSVSFSAQVTLRKGSSFSKTKTVPTKTLRPVRINVARCTQDNDPPRPPGG